MVDTACVETTKVSKIKVSENGKQAVFLNGKKEVYKKIKIDGCAIVNKTACDWWISQGNEESSVLIELKGCDVAHALEQIEATLIYLKKHNLLTRKIAAMIICSKPSTHPCFTSKLQKMKSKMSQLYKAPLHVVTGNHEYEMIKVISHKGPF